MPTCESGILPARSIRNVAFEREIIEGIADHRDVLREPAIAKDLGEMLDLFVSAGWPHGKR